MNPTAPCRAIPATTNATPTSALISGCTFTIDKTFEGRRPRTWIAATPAGRKALAAEIAALREIVGAAEPRPTRGGRAAAEPAA
jgi:Winged helix DNA-binding domain